MKTLLLLFFSIITSVLHAQSLDDSIFVKAGIVKSSAMARTYPIRIWDDFILIDAEVNGVKGTFIWDNGLSFCALDSVFAKKAGVRFNRHKQDTVVDANDEKLSLKVQYANKIQIGDFSIENTPVLDLNIDNGIFKNREKMISGLIGSSFSNRFNWDFDFDNNTVTISAKPFVKNGILLKYIIDPNNNMHYMPITLNGGDLFAQIDFGMVGESFSGADQIGELFAGHPTIKSIGYKSISAGGLSPIDTMFTIRGDYNYLVSGQKILELPDIDISKSEEGFKIGVRFFMHYNTIINNTDTNYILYPRIHRLIPKTKKAYGVFILKEKEELFIGKLTNNPNIYDKDLTIMDKVLSINDKTVKDFYGLIDLRDYQEKLLKEGKSLVIKMATGKIYTFTPQDDIAN